MTGSEDDLDPNDWEAFRTLCHHALDRMIDAQKSVRDRPVWRSIPDSAKDALDAPVPWHATAPNEVFELFERHIDAYKLGNTHPSFWGWVHGSGTMTGLLAEMLQGGLNANLGGREHAPVYVERQVIRWSKEIMGFPAGASGLIVTGTSMATLIALTVARHGVLGETVRAEGMRNQRKLTGYMSAEGHGSVGKAFELVGLGHEQLRLVPVDNAGRMKVDALEASIERDLAGDDTRPFVVIATVGTVNTGALDDLRAIRAVCDRHGLWMHVDGAFGAAAVLAPSIRPHLAGIEAADSLAFDFHKWLHVPYDAGCVLVRDGDLHHRTFGGRADYLQSEASGAAAGEPWFCDYGIELSRGFRALKIWMTLKQYGLDALGSMIEKNCAQARYLADRVDAEPRLERQAPVALNIVCFRYLPAHLSGTAPDHAGAIDALNARIVVALHERGIAVPSSTRIDGALTIRVCICNHRTRTSDLDELFAAVLAIGDEHAAQPVASPG